MRFVAARGKSVEGSLLPIPVNVTTPRMIPTHAAAAINETPLCAARSQGDIKKLTPCRKSEAPTSVSRGWVIQPLYPRIRRIRAPIRLMAMTINRLQLTARNAVAPISRTPISVTNAAKKITPCSVKSFAGFSPEASPSVSSDL